MRTASGILLGSAAAVALIALAPAKAAAPVTIEKSLLGVRILQTYHDVLAKWGQPKLVLRNGEVFEYEKALDSSGNDTGAIKGVSYSGGGGGGGAPGGGGGAPPMGPGGPGPMGGMRKGGMGPGGPGSGGGGGGMGGGSSASQDSDESFGEAGAYAWIYYDPFAKVARVFFFNLEGRVIFIVERGSHGGLPTQRGLKLGDPVKTLYELYGWPDTIQEKDTGFILDYGTTYHAKFAVIKNKVVGIGVVLEESQPLPFFSENGGGGGGGKMGGGAGGGGMMGGGGGRRGGKGGGLGAPTGV